jgi:hypothetical protein
VGGSIGSMVVPLLIGQRFETVGPQVTIVVLFVTVVLAGATVVAFLAVTRRRGAEYHSG